MALLRQLLRGGGQDGEDSGNEEEDRLLQAESDASSQSEEDTAENAEAEEEARRESWIERMRRRDKKKASFDISLPAQHLYLGDMDAEGSGVPSVQETTPQLLPLLYIPARVLFPGETLPMHIFNPHAITMLRESLTRHHPVAVATDLRDSHRLDDVPVRPTIKELATVGTTADILACREDEEPYWYHGPRFIVKFVGRQRFRILEVFKKSNGLMDCRVQILDEHLLPPRPLDLFLCPPSLHASCQALIHQAHTNPSPVTHKMAVQCRQMLQSPWLNQSLCQAPGWTFRFYEFDYLREKLMREQRLNSFGGQDSKDHQQLPENIVDVSYWLARRLPVSDHCKLELLSIDCPTVRIIRGLQLLERFTELYCSGCGNLITKKEHIFSMSVDGPLAAYVNPGGFVHDTLTVTEAVNLRRQGRSSTENSWFPGYQWTIMNCAHCMDHKGWHFEAVKRKLTPRRFFGLCRSGLVLTPHQHQSERQNAS